MSKKSLYIILLFLFSALHKVSINLVGVITLSEVLILISFPIFLSIKDFSIYRKANRVVYSMFLVWGISIVISNILNDTSGANFVKGIAIFVFTFMSFVVFSKILQSGLKAIEGFIIGLILATIINYFIGVDTEQFRFGLLPIITATVHFIAYKIWKKHAILVISTYFSFGIIGLLAGSRASAIVFILASMLMLYSYNRRLSKKTLTFASKKVIVLASVGVVFAFLIQSFYIWAVESKLFPEKYQEKYEMQMARGVPIIFSGRTEIFASTVAIRDAPIIGHGSWAVNLKYSLIKMRGIGERIDNSHEFKKVFTERIPAHSFLLGEWVYHGFFAMTFFLFFFVMLLRGLFYYLNFGNKSFVPLYMYLFVSYSWHTLFSPFGLHQRMFVGFLLAVGSVLWSKSMVNRDKVLNKNGKAL